MATPWGVRGHGVAGLAMAIAEAEGARSFLAIPGYQSYAPQSGQIFGVLQQMKEDFEKDLSESQAPWPRGRGGAHEFAVVARAGTAQATPLIERATFSRCALLISKLGKKQIPSRPDSI